MSTDPPDDTLAISASAPSGLPQVPGYEILRLIGRGGMGRVYKARHLGLNRLVALKMLLSDMDADPKLLARFQIESQAVARLQHPHIAQVFEAGEVEGRPFFAMEFVEGGSLAQRLRGRPQTPHEAAALVELLARAVHFSHEQGILHRDLKPGNILLDSSPRAPDSWSPKITDFGLAKRLHEGTRLTRTGEVVGTPSYMAPEQAGGVVATLGPGVDVHAVGAILYEMLTGRPPFQGPDVAQTLAQVLTMDPVPPRRLQPEVPPDLETICLKCLEKTPKKRYHSAADLADDLHRFQDGRPIHARAVRWWERLAKWARRRPAAALLILVSALAAVGLVIGFLLLQIANHNLNASKRQTEEGLKIARAAIDRMLVRLADELAPVPHSEKVRRESLEDARALYEKLTAIKPHDAEGRHEVAVALGRLGQIYGDLGRLDDAETSYRKADELLTELQRENPTEREYARGHAAMLNNLANIESKRGNLDKAATLVQSALTAMASDVQADPFDPETLKTIAAFHNTLALVLRGQQKFDQALEQHRKALELRQLWRKLRPNDPQARVDTAASHSNLSTLLAIGKQPAQAAGQLTAAAELLASQTAPQQRYMLGQVQANLAVAYEELEQTADAEKTHADARATLEALVADFAAVPAYRHALAREHMNLGRYFGPKGRSEEALRQFQVAQPMLDKLTREFPDHAGYKADLQLCQKFIRFVEEDLAAAKKKGR